MKIIVNSSYFDRKTISIKYLIELTACIFFTFCPELLVKDYDLEKQLQMLNVLRNANFILIDYLD